MGSSKHGESVPWSAQYARRVFDGEWADIAGESGWVTAAVDGPSGEVLGFIQVVPPTNFVELKWCPPPSEQSAELALGFFTIASNSDHPDALPTHTGYADGEVEANAGRLRLTHVKYRWVRDDMSVEMADWIIAGDCSSRRNTTWWDSARENRTSELTEYEDYGLTPEELWFDYPEFDRYDHLIFRDAPVLAKLGVPEEIRLKPVPSMPPEVDS